jgi:hypothetical protein
MNTRDPIPVYHRFAMAPDPEPYMCACWLMWLKAQITSRILYSAVIHEVKRS